MKLYRQGDVGLKAVKRIPKVPTKKRETGTIAYGEVTGHHHSLAPESRSCASVLEAEHGVYIDVFDDSVEIVVGSDTITIGERVYRAGVDFGDITIPEGSYSGAVLMHQEHGPIVLPVGTYEYVPQREYHPENIRYIID